MTDLIAKVKTQYDLVFFDSPPILGVSDGSVLASEVDMTIMVVQHRRFPRAMLQRVKQAVLNVGGRLIGVVLNNVDTKPDDGYSYYNNYNEYYGARRETPPCARPPAPHHRRRAGRPPYQWGRQRLLSKPFARHEILPLTHHGLRLAGALRAIRKPSSARATSSTSDSAACPRKRPANS